MGSCAGKANSAGVVSAHIQPVDPQNANIPPPQNNAAYDDPINHQQAYQPNNPEVQKQNISNPYIDQHSDAHDQSQQPQIQSHKDEQSNNTTKLEEKPNKGQGYDDIDEDDFASQLKKKETPKMAQVKPTEKKHENNLTGDTFALNFPANQFINENAKKEGKSTEENRRYESKNKEKNVRNIIDNPDEMEQSFSSQGDPRKIIGKDNDDDFDVVDNVKQNSHRTIENTSHRQQQSLSSSQQNHIVFHEQQKQSNRASLTESASPMSGVIKNKTPEKEKVIEAQLVHEDHEIYHKPSSHIHERKVHKDEEEEEPIHHIEQDIKSPERVIESKNKHIEESMDFNEPPLKIIDTPKKKETSPQKNSMKISQEKMPWEKNSAPYDDENEIEFFDDELES